MNKLFQTITCSNDDIPSIGASQRPSACDTTRLMIEDMHVMASIGINPEEQLAPQSVYISIDAELINNPNTTRDDIADVVSYDDIVQMVHALVTDRHINLVETLAEDIAQGALSIPGVAMCKVKVSKPDIYKEVGRVGVEIIRYRGSAR